MAAHKFCRTCMGMCALQPITHMQREELLRYTDLEIDTNDGFSQLICTQCSIFLQKINDFRNYVVLMQEKLRELYYCRTKEQRICFNNKLDLKIFIEKKIEKIKPELNSQNEIDDIILVRYPGNVFEVIDTDVEDLIDSIIESNKRLPETSLCTEGSVKDEPDRFAECFPVDTLTEEKGSKKKLTRLDLIDGMPDKFGPNKCRLCKKICSNIKSFYKHLNTVHFGKKTAILCEFCAMRFSDKQKLLRHCRARHGLPRDNSFPCSHCEYKALDKEQLLTHERRTHTLERPFVCDHCGARFFSKRVLAQHAINHSDDKPYQCDKCPSKFKTRQRLCGHKIKIHTRKLVFACPVCDKKLSKSPYMRRHIHREHGIPPERQDAAIRVCCVMSEV